MTSKSAAYCHTVERSRAMGTTDQLQLQGINGTIGTWSVRGVTSRCWLRCWNIIWLCRHIFFSEVNRYAIPIQPLVLERIWKVGKPFVFGSSETFTSTELRCRVVCIWLMKAKVLGNTESCAGRAGSEQKAYKRCHRSLLGLHKFRFVHQSLKVTLDKSLVIWENW